MPDWRKLDLVTVFFLGAVLLAGIVYTSFEFTPSSYGVLLNQIGAPEYGPSLGAADAMPSGWYWPTTGSGVLDRKSAIT